MNELQIDWLDIIIRQGRNFTITKRIVPKRDESGALVICDDSQVIGYHVRCEDHDYTMPVDATYFLKIKNTSFCQMCRKGEARTERKVDPLVTTIRQLLENGVPPIFLETINTLDPSDDD